MRFLTGGESHGPGLTVLLDDVPAGIPLSSEAINHELARRQGGYGRGGRMQIEKDRVEFRGGVRFGKTTGAPVVLWIENRDFKNWQGVMDAEGEPGGAAAEKAFVRPRPGHADLAGYYKYGHTDLRDVLERASARETAARVAAGAVAKALLNEVGITVFSHVLQLGGVSVPEIDLPQGFSEIHARAEGNDLRCAGPEALLTGMRTRIDAARKEGTTLGGTVEIVALGVPPGLGSYAQWDRKLDGQLAQAVMSVHAVKSVSIGLGAEGGTRPGHEFHDAIQLAGTPPDVSLSRPTNRAGGLEGGVTNGMPLLLHAVMKPIATLRVPLDSVNLATGEPEAAHFERSDVTAVPACGVVCEAMVSLTLAQALLAKFGHDTVADLQAALAYYRARLSPSL